MINNIEINKEDLKLKSLYLSKSVHELKNVFITISCIINNEIHLDETDKNDSFNSNTKFLKTLSDFGMFLIQDITKISKMNFFKAEILNNKVIIYKDEKIEPFNLLKCLNFCIKLFQLRANAEKKNIDISLKIDKCLKTKMINTINESRLKQVVINLLSNSYKFTLKGYVSLNCFITKEEKIRIKIIDSGLGFNNEDVDAFSPFQTNIEHQFLNKTGSGLGLLIVKELCESFNSKINYNSIKGKGTEFWFDIENKEIIDQNSIFTTSLKEMLSDINLGKKDNDPTFNYISEKESIYEEDNSSNTQNSDSNYIKKYRSSDLFLKHFSKKNSLVLKKRYSIYNRDNDFINKIAIRKNHFNLMEKKSLLKTSFSEEKISRKNFNSIIHTLKILICDDDSFTAISTRNVVLKYFKLKKKNLTLPDIIFAQNGLECIYKIYNSIIEETSINIVLMDENMPFLSGSNTCAFIKSIFELCHIQIYILSSTYVNINECKADGFFDKPLNIKNMNEIMNL
jgi:CheY-like chemotaxis protein